MIMNGKGEAAKQANSIERTTERGNRGNPSEIARKNTSIRKRKQGVQSTPLQLVAYKNQMGKDEKVNVWGGREGSTVRR